MMAAAFVSRSFNFVKCLELDTLELGSLSHSNVYCHFPLLLHRLIFLVTEVIGCTFSEVNVQASYLRF